VVAAAIARKNKMGVATGPYPDGNAYRITLGWPDGHGWQPAGEVWFAIK